MDGLAQRSGPKVKLLYSRGVMKPLDVITQTRFDKLSQQVFSTVTCSGTPRSTSSVDRISDWSPNKLPVTTDHRCVRWTGTYTPLHSGSYTVLAGAAFRDAYSVHVDGNELIRQVRSEDQSPNSAEVALRQGVPARVEVEYIPDADANRLGIGVKATEELIAPEAKAIAAQADAVVLSVGYGPDTEGESHDRTYELPFGQAELIKEIGAVNAKTIVAVTSGGAYERRIGSRARVHWYRPGTSDRKVVAPLQTCFSVLVLRADCPLVLKAAGKIIQRTATIIRRKALPARSLLWPTRKGSLLATATTLRCRSLSSIRSVTVFRIRRFASIICM
ncbi:MAG: beta-glucosidase [Acidobacteriaceae bacterium]|nr:beta-glucosidase [Acidobacteriaceae bacterium]